MHDDSTPKKRWQIRVLNGPARGVSRVLNGRLTIGRAASCDIHLAASSVSRQHAKIIEDADGHHVLVDLASSNGTLVDGLPVERHVLRSDTFFTIADIDLAYEAAATERSAVARERPRIDTMTLRSTTELRRAAGATRDYPSAREIDAERAAVAFCDADGQPLVFESPEGGEYMGNLVEDVLEVRSLRAQHLRGGFAEPAMRQRFEQLQQRMRQPPSADPRISQRAFCRFGCWFPARLALPQGDPQACRVRDFGVDGAQVVIEQHELRPDTTVWLTFELIDGRGTRSIELGARVAWVDDEFVGLSFAGSPRPQQGRYAERRAVTSRRGSGAAVARVRTH